MKYTFDNLDEVEFVPALEIGDSVEFEHNGASYAGVVDWLLADGYVSVMVDGQPKPFIAEQKIFKLV